MRSFQKKYDFSDILLMSLMLLLSFVLVPTVMAQTKEKPDKVQKNEVQEEILTIVRDGQAEGVILWWSKKGSHVPPFAASELQDYYQKMSGAKIPVIEAEISNPLKQEITTPSSVIVVMTGSRVEEYLESDVKDEIISDWISDISFQLRNMKEDSYVIQTRGNSIILAGENDRGTLYAVYNLLKKQGVRFWAPQFDFYKGNAERIPTKDTIKIPVINIQEEPSIKYRKKYVEEGWSFNPENLKQLVDWMAKQNLNVLNYPHDYQGLGLTEYDMWREELLPALKKRGMIMEVGGHGFQSWLSPEKYPQYYSGKEVFDVTDKHAMQTYISNVISYLEKRPEIQIFDAWPPDGRDIWPSKVIDQYGSSQNAEAYVVKQLTKEVERQLPGVKIEEIAYTDALIPPDAKYMYDPKLNIIDIAPYGRSYKVPIYDRSNKDFVELIQQWPDSFGGTIGIYEYYRKYLFHSLPVVLVDLIGQDIPYYKSIGINGLGIYAEPADWITYELTHLEVAMLLWNTELNTKKIIPRYLHDRYGVAADEIQKYLDLIENGGGMLFSFNSTKNKTVVPKIRQIYLDARKILQEAVEKVKEGSQSAYILTRLIWGIDYAIADIEILYYSLEKRPEKQKEAKKRAQQISEIHRFDGIIMLSMWTMRSYASNYTGHEGRERTRWIYDMYRDKPVIQLSLSSPKTISPRQTTQLTSILKNYSRYAAEDVRLQLNVPSGWKVEASTSSHFGQLDNNPTKPVKVRWTVKVPKDARPGSSVQLSVKVHYSYAGTPLSFQKQKTINVEQARK